MKNNKRKRYDDLEELLKFFDDCVYVLEVQKENLIIVPTSEYNDVIHRQRNLCVVELNRLDNKVSIITKIMVLLKKITGTL
ncbi:MAG: hypothetical protein PHS33_07820 [Candidatus Omnitrophica bacterium]|nr:hypothetical protein [Candidatus Omnitrophota bacterium]